MLMPHYYQADLLNSMHELLSKLSQQSYINNTSLTKQSSTNRTATTKQGSEGNGNRNIPIDSYSEPRPKQDFSESSKSKTTEAQKLQKRQTFKCSQCPMCYTRKAYLIKHVLCQHGTLNNCLKCMQIFTNDQEYDNHMLIFHSTFNCELCGAAFKNNFKLKHHIETHKDSRDNLFKCSLPNCVYSHNLYTYFKYHVNKHRKKKPLCCGKCKKLYLARYMFNRHVATCIGDFGVCPKCDKEYSSDSMLYDHVQTCHVGNIYACPECDNTYKWRALLLRHLTVDHRRK